MDFQQQLSFMFFPNCVTVTLQARPGKRAVRKEDLELDFQQLELPVGRKLAAAKAARITLIEQRRAHNLNIELGSIRKDRNDAAIRVRLCFSQLVDGQ